MSDKETVDNQDQQPPKIEFPCDYPIKAIGDATADFQQVVVDIMHKHCADFDESTVSVVDSRNGSYQSVRVTIVATGKDQIEAIFEDLKATGRIRMVL